MAMCLEIAENSLKKGELLLENKSVLSVGFDTIINQAYDAIDLDEYVEPIPDLTEMVDHCVERNLKLSIITASSRQWVMRVLKYLQLTHVVDVIVSKEDFLRIGCARKDTEAFELVINQMQLSASELVYMDDRTENLAMPFQMGLYSVLIASQWKRGSKYLCFQSSAICLSVLLESIDKVKSRGC
jgi:FMN phosphatase YigB (HAD superfamily)